MKDKPTEGDGVWMGGQVPEQIYLYSTPSHTIPPLVKRQITLVEENMPANLSAEDERWLGEVLGGLGGTEDA